MVRSRTSRSGRLHRVYPRDIAWPSAAAKCIRDTDGKHLRRQGLGDPLLILLTYVDMPAGNDDDDTCCFCLPGSLVDQLGARCFRAQPSTGKPASQFWRELCVGWQCSPPGGSWLSWCCFCCSDDEAPVRAMHNTTARHPMPKRSDEASRANSWQVLYENEPLSAWEISIDDVDRLAHRMEYAARCIQEGWRHHQRHPRPGHAGQSSPRQGTAVRLASERQLHESASHQLRSQHVVAPPPLQPPPSSPHVLVPQLQPPLPPPPPSQLTSPPPMRSTASTSVAVPPPHGSPTLAHLIDELEHQLAVSPPQAITQMVSPYESKPAEPLHAPVLSAGAARPPRHPSPNPSVSPHRARESWSTSEPRQANAELDGEVFYV